MQSFNNFFSPIREWMREDEEVGHEEAKDLHGMVERWDDL